MVQLMPLPLMSLASVNPDWFYLSDTWRNSSVVHRMKKVTLP